LETCKQTCYKGRQTKIRMTSLLLSKRLLIYSVNFEYLFTLENEANLLEMEEPVVIVGDIHGQYYDLCHLIQKAGDPDGTK